MTPRKLRATGTPDTLAPTYRPHPHTPGRRVLVDGRGNLLGYADRRPGRSLGWRVRAPRGRAYRGQTLVDVGAVPSLPWAAILLEQHRATGRRQRSGVSTLRGLDT